MHVALLLKRERTAKNIHSCEYKIPNYRNENTKKIMIKGAYWSRRLKFTQHTQKYRITSYENGSKRPSRCGHRCTGPSCNNFQMNGQVRPANGTSQRMLRKVRLSLLGSLVSSRPSSSRNSQPLQPLTSFLILAHTASPTRDTRYTLTT